MLNPWPYLNFSILFQLNCLGVKDFVAFSQMKRGVNCLGVKMTKKEEVGITWWKILTTSLVVFKDEKRVVNLSCSQ